MLSRPGSLVRQTAASPSGKGVPAFPAQGPWCSSVPCAVPATYLSRSHPLSATMFRLFSLAASPSLDPCASSPSGHSLSAAAIIGHDGNVWAQSATFPELKQGEVEKLLNGFEENSPLAQNGLFLGGSKYMVLQGDLGIVIRGKKGLGGCCVRKTNSALVIGQYDDPCTPGECNIAVEKLGEYLFEQGI